MIVTGKFQNQRSLALKSDLLNRHIGKELSYSYENMIQFTGIRLKYIQGIRLNPVRMDLTSASMYRPVSYHLLEVWT